MDRGAVEKRQSTTRAQSLNVKRARNSEPDGVDQRVCNFRTLALKAEEQRIVERSQPKAVWINPPTPADGSGELQ